VSSTDVAMQVAPVSADLLPPLVSTPIPDSGYKPLRETIVNGMRTVLSTYFLREKVRVSVNIDLRCFVKY
jgi:hypothetical protein